MASYRTVVRAEYAHQMAERLRCLQVCNEIDERDGKELAASFGPPLLRNSELDG
jgi:hypothetical protein